MDSATAVNLVLNGCDRSHHYSTIMELIKNLMNRDCQIKVSLVYKEANMVADRLVNTAHKLGVQDMDMCIFISPPSVCRHQLDSDSGGVSFPRLGGASFLVSFLFPASRERERERI